MKPQPLIVPVAGLLLASSLQAAVFLSSETLVSSNTIGDPPSAGLARTLNVSTGVTALADITVTLDIASAAGDHAWNGDLYVQLTSPGGTVVVLLDRVGLSASDTTTGYGDAGFNITLNDYAANDVHQYRTFAYTLNGSNQLTGTWQSDGRTSATSASRPARLSSLLGENPNGTWTLLAVDLASGGLAQLTGWSVSGTDVSPVPESSWTMAAAGAACGLAGFVSRRRVSNRGGSGSKEAGLQRQKEKGKR